MENIYSHNKKKYFQFSFFVKKKIIAYSNRDLCNGCFYISFRNKVLVRHEEKNVITFENIHLSRSSFKDPEEIF